jgi:hypothetical protein
VFRKLTFSLNEMQRSAPLRPGFGQQQSAGRKVEGGKADSARRLRPGRLPAQPPRDHEVQDQEQLVVQFQDESLAEPAQATDRFPRGLCQRRGHTAQQKRAAQPHLVQGLSDDAGMQTFQIDHDIR